MVSAVFFRVLVVAEHEAGREHLYFLVVGVDAVLDVHVGLADRADFGLAGRVDVRVVEVFGHAVAFEELEAEAAVPGKELRGEGGRAGAGDAALGEAEGGLDLLLDEHAEDGDGEEGGELLGRHLLEDAGLELGPEARDGEEERGLCALQVLRKGGEGLGEVDLERAVDGGAALVRPARHAVRQRQVGENAVLEALLAEVAPEAVGGVHHGLEGVHDALGLPRAARGVDDGGHLLRRALRDLVVRHGLVLLQQVVPLDVVALGAEREGHRGHVRRHARLHHLVPVLVQLPHEQQLRLRVLQRVLHRLGRQRRVDRHGGVSRHPDGHVRDHEPHAVLRHDGDLRSGFQVQGFDVAGHAPCLCHSLRPRVALHVVLVPAHGLDPLFVVC
mmetsp:Transcript_4914/g.6461  ORF Transcript_4914/g.6461 Transcript_4914/m.6461 type:complete len:387 (+) Transcript_4914:901-2061(+)